MSARPRMILRSHPGRAAALAIAVLLASGAVVAALSGGPDGSGQRQKSLSSNALRPVAGGAAAGVGGWVQASQTGTDQATLTLKVPSDKLEGVIGTIRGLGKVTSVSETGEDVTAEFVDLEAWIGHWRAQEAVFVGLMGKA